MSDLKHEIITLPSIRDDENGNRYLTRLAEKILKDADRHYSFNFNNCSVLDQNAVAMLGGLARVINVKSSIGRKISKGISNIMLPKYGTMFLVDTMNQLVRENLIENNFLSYFTQDNYEGYPSGGYIGYREHTSYLDVNEIVRHLSNEWLTAEKLVVSSDLKNAIVSRIFEIFANAYGHGTEKFGISGVGVISCGQYSKKEGILRLTVLDFGMGIVKNVERHTENTCSGKDAMTWALTTGNSTKTDSLDDIPRGLGFGLLSEFVTLNNGALSVYSNSYCALAIGAHKYDTSILKNDFLGTMVNISIVCDDNIYHFLNEDTSEQYF